MWVDLEADLAEAFGDCRFDIRDYDVSFVGSLFDNFKDPHADADRWLSASEENRAGLRQHYDAMLARKRAENARALIRSAKTDKRTPEENRRRVKLYLDTKRQDTAWREKERLRDRARGRNRTPEQRARRAELQRARRKEKSA
jgi:hypothetical protein